ncbi:MAG TPA: hypothetical protein PKN96_06325 [Flavobacterium sp.]|uniref:hypothetical protein n=1 Tax=Flavobacterium sp. TaxID=239 RepID=UPI002C8EA43B|nr:hypothetical protein [Flavobacterium sp.]HNP32889.1 hypothetical protein [Flavobacterium sp.]
MKKNTFKTVSLLLILLLLFFVWNYYGPKAIVENEKVEKDIKPKFHNYNKDSLVVYIPYKFSIRNIGFKKIKLKSIICPLKSDGTIYSQLVYSQNGHESLVLGDFNDFTDENIINPFESKTFYFYHKENACKKDFLNAEYVEDLYKKLPGQIVDKHIKNLKDNVAITERNDIISKLYQQNKNNDVEVTLTDRIEKSNMTRDKIEIVTTKYEENYIIRTQL